ncbi:thioredoxin family protein [Hippea maritima]|uniref:Thioredoxin domain-containing protein n=1 Tax=Hippea maritima (strain ATCC 700847 / DSM 10411 / MH2) TaxID=760142 RepID=F2LX45_HIPMA|nr:thioredoxin family protein [Hippea maritima]AEA33103.1 Thioredoxin domain-containing protein [Hippea maritima DSM 10411]
MKELDSKEEFESFIQNKKPSIVVFSTHDCATCKPVKDKIASRFKDIDAANIYLDDVRELAGELSIFNVPVVCIYLEGKELYRFIRVFSLDKIEEKINRIMEFI